jgi:hypothetical protein
MRVAQCVLNRKRQAHLLRLISLLRRSTLGADAAVSALMKLLMTNDVLPGAIRGELSMTWLLS